MRKRFSALCLLLCVSILLCGCDPSEFYFDYQAMKADTISIELITYDNDLSNIIEVKKDSKLIFDSSKVISSKQLNENLTDDFLRDLSKITFHLLNDSTLEPVKECTKINMSDGSFVILSCTLVDKIGYSMVAEFDSNGNFVKHIAFFADRPSYERMISKYFK